jgi:hypothetical protein
VFLTETRVVVVDVETEVENNANVIYLNEPRREWGGVGIHIHKKKKFLVSDTDGSGLLIEMQTDLTRGANDNVTVIDVRRRVEKITRIVCSYDHRDGQFGDRQAHEEYCQGVIRLTGTIPIRVFNVYSRLLDLKCRVQLNAAIWVELIHQNDRKLEMMAGLRTIGHERTLEASQASTSN